MIGLQPERDFFGRLITGKEDQVDAGKFVLYPVAGKLGLIVSLPLFSGEPNAGSTKRGRPQNLHKPKIVFKFNEGFSNAVRKPVYVRDLL